jgi:hypothetical protein
MGRDRFDHDCGPRAGATTDKLLRESLPGRLIWPLTHAFAFAVAMVGLCAFWVSPKERYPVSGRRPAWRRPSLLRLLR